MNKRKIAMILMVMIMMFLIGCANKPQAQKANDIFANEEKGLLFVKNETDVDLVLFASNITRGIVLGGIRAMSSRNFDILKIVNIPLEGAFMIDGISLKTYQQKGQFITQDDILYSGIVVFNLKNVDKIQKIIPGTYDATTETCIIVSNDSRSVCELRLHSPDGIAIIALRPFERNRRIWIRPSMSGYMFFPNFIGYENGELKNVSDKRGMIANPVPVGGREPMMSISFTDNFENKGMQIQLLFE
jgi:hypothetical protein